MTTLIVECTGCAQVFMGEPGRCPACAAEQDPMRCCACQTQLLEPAPDGRCGICAPPSAFARACDALALDLAAA